MAAHVSWEQLRNIPIVKVCPGAIEIASLLAHAVRLNDRQAVEVALTIQNAINNGHLTGRVVTGDHDEDGKTMLDWNDLEKTTTS